MIGQWHGNITIGQLDHSDSHRDKWPKTSHVEVEKTNCLPAKSSNQTHHEENRKQNKD